MPVEERRLLILEELRRHERLAVEDAARLCGVSPDTIRRDFNRLAERQEVRRTHGGIVLPRVPADTVRDATLAERSRLAAPAKRAIAREAARLIGDNETIVIDGGSTTLEIVSAIEARDVTVITACLDIASRALARDNLNVYLVGGTVRRATAMAVGDETVRALRSLSASVAFLGASGFGREHGLMTTSPLEASVKRAILAIADRRVALVDSSKREHRALARFAGWSDIDLFITDDGITPEYAANLEREGVAVRRCPVGG